MRWLWLGIALAVGGCTSPNPKSCADGTCGDPAFPFCDVNGTLGGLPNECIAPSCASRTFAECRGDHEVRCNETGDDYAVTRCEHGCDPGIGCRACEPSQTVCTNGAVMTCDPARGFTVVEECPLGCYDNEARCRQVEPSNGLGVYLDMVSSPPDLDLGEGATIDVATGTITLAAGGTLEVPSFLQPAATSGVPIRVFVANEVTLGDVSVVTSGTTSPALAIVATGAIEVRGQLTVATGASLSLVCQGSPGEAKTATDGTELQGGGGGGSHATSGAPGGNASTGQLVAQGGSPGMNDGAETLVPLRGGCRGGSSRSDLSNGGTGGGAVQLTSQRTIIVTGAIVVDGSPPAGTSNRPSAGGGSGGSALLEAPTVDLTSSGRISARGGAGGGCLSNAANCARGGAGATAETSAMPGDSLTNGIVGQLWRGGGGGGGLGRIRINTKTGTFTTSSDFVLNGQLTKGTVATR